ncbi:laccase [Phialemonium atrogriseum]|uniref:laccase n=1 Tax=Phialemonium atrogriseum TaxID=1093897 RepID=A0AAJ0FEL0_9PEZI|nr:laccase [Phialemonium atrogriseum]KAK1764472.1 laccase [Phialemonium atrogriseum]
MRSLFTAFVGLTGLFSSVHGAPSAELVKRAPTCNTPSNRACWTTGFDINTDYLEKTPLTGKTVTYTLVVTEIDNWKGPDGVVKKKAMLINGTLPGPTIVADWGDRLNITVINNLRDNGTSFHWHGLRQMGSNFHDGVNGVTECPIPPKGGKRLYSFLATQYGTGWYHSHFSAQYANGVVGNMVINGPASLPYDIDLGVFPISDYYYETADNLVEFTMNNGPPPSDNVLFNGTNIHPVTGAGKYARVKLTPGKRHRLRLINPSVENHFTVSLVDHQMTVIGTDYVPSNAFTTDSLFIGVGQRYDVTIDASKAVGNYWFNVTFGGNGFCGLSNNPFPAAIFSYDGAPNANPTKAGTPPADSLCLDNLNLTPVVPRSAPPSGFTPSASNKLDVHLDTTGTPLFVWRINGNSIKVDWQKPIGQYVMDGNNSFPANANIVKVDAVNQWTYWLVENDPDGAFSLPHPFHLHGHDFLVLGRSPDTPPAAQTRYVFNPATDMGRLNGGNPTRRDVTMLPAKGWVLIAFKTDNPGAWLMHCHIAWHVSGGLSVDFLERVSEFKAGITAADKAIFDNNCNAWRTYAPTNQWSQIDSGI